ncbi:MAG: acyl carrier protein [Bacteroidia bacterium]
MKEKIKQFIIEYLRQLKGELNLQEELALYGREGGINSFELVSLIVELEEFILNENGANITIADDRAFSMNRSPFRTVATLTDYTIALMNENPDSH